jgi:hypothetical protein
VKTIAEGLSAAQSSGKIVLVCNTTYDEQVKITFGAKVYGGFKCGEWSYEAASRATVKPTARGHALEVTNVAAEVVIEDMEFEAKAGVDPGESSVAAFIASADNVSLLRVGLVAGAGQDGAIGSLAPVTHPPLSALKGNSATNDNGAPVKSDCTCPAGGATAGGAGGDGGIGVTGGGPGQPNGPGGTAGTGGSSCTAGGNGSAGIGDQDGASPSVSGTVSATGWLGSAGPSGLPGMPGQGGGGGGGDSDGGGGGSGGCGGCGGAGAIGGGAGGSSIGLLVFNSTVSFLSGEVSVANGATGGAGLTGQPGQSPGGAKGTGFDFGCEGGNGGPGGGGGASAGGAGGISVGIVFNGTAPASDGTTFALGQKGLKGAGGKPGVNDGIDGVAENQLALP